MCSVSPAKSDMPLFPIELQERNRIGLLAAALGSSITLEGLTTSCDCVQYGCAEAAVLDAALLTPGGLTSCCGLHLQVCFLGKYTLRLFMDCCSF